MFAASPPFDAAAPQRTIHVLGAPVGLGCPTPGAELGPAAIRLAGLSPRLASLGLAVRDLGDISVPGCGATDQALRNLSEIAGVCERLCASVRETLDEGCFPLVLGGDHSVALGTVSGVSSWRHASSAFPGLIWFDAHADMNTPETSPSGNIHGMPLAALLGYGDPALTGIGGFAPKLDPRFCAHVGARDLDDGERALIHKTGIRFFTMREIDERGMGACMRDAIAIASRALGGFAVTFDIDVLDPLVAPGSGTLARGGLTYREAHLALEMVAESGGLRALEVTEVNAAVDVGNRTADLAVELIGSALGRRIL